MASDPSVLIGVLMGVLMGVLNGRIRGRGSRFLFAPEACVSFSVVAPLAQSAERLHGKEKVYGSIP